ncbi:MAG: thermonuclease family protein [Pseudomonadota bacterium]
MRARALALTLAIFLASHLSTSAWSAEIIGRPSVIDGDTIEIHGTRIRLSGIDAPESWQSCKRADDSDYRCGRDAANALDEWLAKSLPTRCREVDRDRYRRVVAECWRADGHSVATWMVRNGHALDWPHYSLGAYADDERAAESSRSGLWQGSFIAPWDARKRRRLGM